MKLWNRFIDNFLWGWGWVDVGCTSQRFHKCMLYLKLHCFLTYPHWIHIPFTRSHEIRFFANQIHTTFRGGLKCNSIRIITDASQSGHLCWISKCLLCHLQHDTQWQHQIQRWKYIQVAQSGWAESINQSLIYGLILFSQSISLNHTPSLNNPDSVVIVN